MDQYNPVVLVLYNWEAEKAFNVFSMQTFIMPLYYGDWKINTLIELMIKYLTCTPTIILHGINSH